MQHLRELKQKEASREALSKASGITNQAILDKLLDLGIRPEIELAEKGPIDHDGRRVPETGELLHKWHGTPPRLERANTSGRPRGLNRPPHPSVHC